MSKPTNSELGEAWRIANVAMQVHSAYEEKRDCPFSPHEMGYYLQTAHILDGMYPNEDWDLPWAIEVFEDCH